MKRLAYAYIIASVFFVVPVYAQQPRITVGITSYSSISDWRGNGYSSSTSPSYVFNEPNENEQEEDERSYANEYNELSVYNPYTNSSFDGDTSYSQNDPNGNTNNTATPFDPIAFWDVFHLTQPNEVTFDTQRSITGVAQHGTAVVVYVISSYTNDFNDINHMVYENTIVVGSSGVFSLELPLEEGDNIVVIKFFDPVNNLEGNIVFGEQTEQNVAQVASTVLTTQIRRMAQEIQQELEFFVPRLPGSELELELQIPGEFGL